MPGTAYYQLDLMEARRRTREGGVEPGAGGTRDVEGADPCTAACMAIIGRDDLTADEKSRKVLAILKAHEGLDDEEETDTEEAAGDPLGLGGVDSPKGVAQGTGAKLLQTARTESRGVLCHQGAALRESGRPSRAAQAFARAIFGD